MIAVLIGCGLRRAEAAALKGRHPTPRRTLGNRRSEWKGRSHPHGPDARLGKERNRRVDSVRWTYFRPAV